MAEKKKSIRDLMADVQRDPSPSAAGSAGVEESTTGAQESGAGAGDTGGEGRRRRSAPLNSPLLHRPKVEDTFFKTRILPLNLPVTGGEVNLRLEDIDPNRCFASEMNPREQKLLSMDDPEVARIARSIQQEGQREPVLARVLRDGESVRYEVIYGTTRLFIAGALGLKLRAWLGEIPDVDARRLARAENAERRDLSAWEKGADLKRMMETIYAGRTQEFVAEQEGISRPQLTKLLRVADLELDVIGLLKSPHEVSVATGPGILMLLEEMSEQRRNQVLRKAQGNAPFETAAALLKQLKVIKAEDAPTAGALSKRKPLVIERSRGKPIMKVTPHREREGQYKVDLFGFSQEEIEALVTHVKQNKGLDKG